MLQGKTGVLDIVSRDGDVQTFAFNGDVKERADARQAFESAIKMGGVLAAVHTAPGQATQVRKWDEVEKIEREVGTVAVTISPQVVGG